MKHDTRWLKCMSTNNTEHGIGLKGLAEKSEGHIKRMVERELSRRTRRQKRHRVK